MKKRNKGSALILTVLVMGVVSILAFTTIAIAQYENINTSREQNRIGAYYAARSGAEATATWMAKNPVSAGKIIGNESEETMFGSDSNTSFKVKVRSDVVDPDIIYIESTGTVDNVTSTAILEMKKTNIDNAGYIFQYAVYSAGEINLQGSSFIEGDIRSALGITGADSSHLDGDAYPYDPMDLPLPVFPADPSSAPILNVNNDFVINDSISSSYIEEKTADTLLVVCKRLEVGGGQTKLQFDTQNYDIILVTEELNFQTGAKGEIEILGDGNVTIYSEKVVKFNTAVNKNGKPSQMLIILGKDAELKLASNDIMKMFVYGPEATSSITGTPYIHGGLILYDAQKLSGNINITNKDGYNEGLPDDVLTGPQYTRRKWIK
jgi:hypothetical protein